ncbi:MAG: phosphoenolpyruvate--protein phosphotransferase [Pyrinomonadaceae bacterium]
MPSMSQTEKEISREVVLNGRAVSRGIGVGKVLCLYGNKRQFYKIRIEPDMIERETRRFRAAVRLAKLQLRHLTNGTESEAHENLASIFDTHLLFLEDKSLLSKIETTISEEMVNAEWAVKSVSDSYISRYKQLSDKHLREKYIDLEDIAERLLTALGGGKRSEVSFGQNMVIVAKEVNPSTIVEISQSRPAAIVTENGGWTSHTFILARELGIPAITGLYGLMRRVGTGDELIVDGFSGQAILNPESETAEKFDRALSDIRDAAATKESFERDAITTLDGFEVTIRANLDIVEGYKKAESMGAKGIGLFRSEFLFNQYRGFPSENEQYENYVRVADKVGADGVKIRTFDLSADQLAGRTIEIEKNPALGLRAIRLGFRFETELRRQIRALLRASYNRNIGIVIPMVSEVSEMRRVRRIMAEEKEKLTDLNVDFGDPQLGAMIEVPSAVLVIDSLAEESDFISVGTNDLVQYLLAADRDNEEVSDWFQTLHPAVLKSVKMILDSASKHDTPAIICGEMAGTPLYAVILVGLGAAELSMNIGSINRVATVISGIALEEARSVANELLECKTADSVEKAVRELFISHWEHLFDDSLLPRAV